MKQNESKTNKTLLRVLLAAAAVLILCCAAIGAAAGAAAVVTDEKGLTAAVAVDNFDVVLGADIELTNTLEIQKTGTLDLAGHILNYIGNNSAITVKSGSSAHLTITDSDKSTVRYFQVSDVLNNLYTPWKFIGAKPDDATSENTIALEDITSYENHHGWAAKIGANYIYHYVTIPGGIITGSSGKGVIVGNGTTLTLSGGTIVGTSATTSGSGVWVEPSSTLEIAGGNIAGNKTSLSGGGVVSAGTVIMSGGSIVGNCADGNGGGVDIDGGTFTMTGGRIIGNFAKMGGGGVQFDSGAFEVSGKPVINGNCSFVSIDNVKDNLNINKLKITLAGKLNDGANIGITQSDALVGTSFGLVKADYTDPAETDADYFHTDSNKMLAAVLDTTVSPASLKWAGANPVTPAREVQHGTITADPDSAAVGRTVTLTVISDEGYLFRDGSLKAYKLDEPEQTVPTTKVTDTKYTFTMPDYAVAVYAVFDDVILVRFDMQGHGTQVPSQTFISGSKVTRPADPSADGFAFGGWYKEAACTNEWDFNTAVTEDMTLYAKWTEWTIDTIGDQDWTGEPIEPEVTVRSGDKILIKDTDYTVSYSDNINPGIATVTVKGIGHYSGTKTAHFNIMKDMSECKIDRIHDQAYTGYPVTPKVTVRDGDKILVKDIDYTVTYRNNTDIGIATAVVKGKNYYTGTKEANFEIADPAELHSVTFEYSGDAPCDILPEEWVFSVGDQVTLTQPKDMKFSGYTFEGWDSSDEQVDEELSETGNTFEMPAHDVLIRGNWEKNDYFEEITVIKEINIAYINGGVDDRKDGVKAYVFAADNIDEDKSAFYLADYEVSGKSVPDPTVSPGYTDFRDIAKFNIKAELNDSQKPSKLDIYVTPDENMGIQNICLLQYNATANGGVWSSPIKPDAGYPVVYSGDVYEYVYTVDSYNTPFALVYEKPVKKGGSSSQGTSYWATPEPTETPTPTPTATPTPVETPTVKPVATETPTAKSPAPFMGILAGLGAAAVIFGLRRK